MIARPRSIACALAAWPHTACERSAEEAGMRSAPRQTGGPKMPERKTMQKARNKLRHGRAASTAAGEFVREEMHHVRRGKHGARSTKQAIAIGLSKARRAGVPLRPPKRGASARTRTSAPRAYDVGQHKRKPR